MAHSASSGSSASTRWKWILGGLLVVGLLGSVAAWPLLSRPSRNAVSDLDAARAAWQQRQYDQAETLALRALEHHPRRLEAALLAGDSAAAQQAWSRAIEHWNRGRSDDPSAQLQIALRMAELYHRRTHELGAAIASYQAVLAIDPDHVAANAGLVELLTLCGRTREATPSVLRLIRRGGEPDLLLLFVRGDVTRNDLPALQQARQADPTDPNPLIGLAWHALQKDAPNDAEPLLREALELDPDNVPARLLLGRRLISSGRMEEFAGWADGWPKGMESFAEAWLLRGQMAEAVRDRAGALRCYWESVRLGPESKPATARLVQLLAELGETAAAAAFRQRVEAMIALEEIQNRVLITADRGRTDQLFPLAMAYAAAGRLWEAYGWCQFAIEVNGPSADAMAFLNQLTPVLQREPIEQVPPSVNIARTLDLSRYPIPHLIANTPAVSDDLPTAWAPPTFRDDAAAVGLEFRYVNGIIGPTKHRMFEFTGGGLGVFDYDLDAWPDLFCTQGGLWPPRSDLSGSGDQLFRNRCGERFEDVTTLAGLSDVEFGQGVSIGDVNADGFPDVYVGNIGQNRLWLNLGDGTFRDVTTEAGLTATAWTTSLLVADLTGDGWPDLYDVNYLADADVFDRLCQNADGSTRMCLPSDFHEQPDRFWKNLGDGRFVEATADTFGEPPGGMGLGIAAWDADGSGRLSVYVANDTTPSFFFRPERDGRMRECGVETGLAFNGAGKATGCMGIALGDVDGDGRLDLHVTNFAQEPNTLFLNSTPGFFEDRTRPAGLEQPSLPMLGFGTQLLDADLDGRLELFVANGHVDDLTRIGRPYRMPPQLFRGNNRGRFEELPAAAIGPYFEAKWLGRAAVRLDWNRDGREDLAIGHLHDRIALLTNTTASSGGHLALRLFRAESNRDALGTTVQVRIGDRTQVRQLTAGDGYHGSNERQIVIGTGPATVIDELRVRWPSGREQRFENVSVPTEHWLREGHELATPP